MKHEAGFAVRLSTDPNHPAGTLTWTTPLGRTYLSAPEPLGPVRLARPVPRPASNSTRPQQFPAPTDDEVPPPF